jgi:hypothetical protein
MRQNVRIPHALVIFKGRNQMSRDFVETCQAGCGAVEYLGEEQALKFVYVVPAQ